MDHKIQEEVMNHIKELKEAKSRDVSKKLLNQHRILHASQPPRCKQRNFNNQIGHTRKSLH